MTPINFIPDNSAVTPWKKGDSPLFGVTNDSSIAQAWLQKPSLIPWAAAGLILALSWILPFLIIALRFLKFLTLNLSIRNFYNYRLVFQRAADFDQQKSDIRDFSALFVSSP